MKGFRLNIIIRAIVLLALCLVLAWVLTNRNWFFTPLVISILLLGAIWNMIHYVEKTSRNLSHFLLNIKQGGFMASFKNQDDLSHDLHHVYDDIIQEFQSVTLEKEANYLYLKTLNENIGVGLISYDENGLVDLYNPSAKSILKKPLLLNTKDLKGIDSSLDKVLGMQSGERTIIKAVIENELTELSVICKKFKVKDVLYTLLILQNINAELEQKEIEAWQKLISVLTHEIMNSVTPISSLSGALNSQLKDVDLKTLSMEDQADIKKSLVTIENRSKGLMRFVNAYKEFTRRPELNYSQFSINEMVEEAKSLLEDDIKKLDIHIEINGKSDIKCKGDRQLLTQVIINLLKNAMDILAHQESKIIAINISREYNRNMVAISDSGPGIDDELLDKIFIPFFTTKSKGTGVGLSFAKKVIRLHNGQLKVISKKNKGTTFSLIW